MVVVWCGVGQRLPGSAKAQPLTPSNLDRAWVQRRSGAAGLRAVGQTPSRYHSAGRTTLGSRSIAARYTNSNTPNPPACSAARFTTHSSSSAARLVMFSRSKHNKTRHGSASSVDLSQQLNNPKPPTDSGLAPIPGSPVQGSAVPQSSKSSTGGRAFNFLVERARGGTSRARTTSDEGHNTKTRQQAEGGQAQDGRPATSSGAGLSSGGGGGGGLFGRKGSITSAEASSVASSSNPSVANSINIPGASADRALPSSKSSGGFFRRQVTQSNPPKPGWLSKGGASQAAPTPSPLSASPSSPTLVRTSELPMPEATKKDQYGRKHSMPVSEGGGVSRTGARATPPVAGELTHVHADHS